MAEQLQYTSAERGLGGHAGFQFVAASPSVTPDLQHAVQQLMTYRPPPDAPSQPDPRQRAQLPVSLSYQRIDGQDVVVRCHYLGTDYSGRFGNFLGHALIGAADEFDGIRPIELWQASLWPDEPTAHEALPELHDIDPGHEISPEFVARLLDQRGDAGYRLLADLLDALVDCLNVNRGQLVLVGSDTGQIATWIAALCYSLPFSVAAHLSFITYSADPDAAQQRIVGTTPAVWSARTRSGPGFLLDQPELRRTDDVAGGPGRFSRAVVAAWRDDDLAALDTIGELAEAFGGDLTLAASLQALADGLELTTPECRAIADGLVQHGRDLPAWVWEIVTAGVPHATMDVAAATYRAASPQRRQAIEATAAVPFTTALSEATDLRAVADVLRIAEESEISVHPGDVRSATFRCARTGAGDLLSSHRASPGRYRRDMLDGALSGLAAADDRTRAEVLTPDLCDWLVDLDWSLDPRVWRAVVLSVGRRRRRRRIELIQRFSEVRGELTSTELAHLITSMWGMQMPAHRECLAICRSAGLDVAAEPELLAFFGRTLVAGKLRADGARELASTIVQLSTDPGAQAVSDARLVLAIHAVTYSANGSVASITAAIDHLSKELGNASRTLAAAAVAAVADDVLAPAKSRTQVAVIRDVRQPELRREILDRLAQSLSGHALAELALRMHAAGLSDAALDQQAARQVKGKGARKRVERALEKSDPTLVNELEALIERTRPDQSRWRRRRQDTN